MDGINLVALIDGTMQGRGKRIGFRTPDGGERGRENRLGSPDHALIGDRYNLLACLDDERIEEDMLFDLAVDPGERHNLVEELPELVASMKSELKDWNASCLRNEEGLDYPAG